MNYETHAPSGVRQVFEDALEAVSAWKPGRPLPSVNVHGRDVGLDDVCRLVWNCTDMLSGRNWQHIEDLGANQQQIHTYASGARALKQWFEAVQKRA